MRHFLSCPQRPRRIADIAGRVYRISFSGELAYELAVPAQHARSRLDRLLEAGTRYGIMPYGLDALNTLRIEKGHVTGAELNGNTSADDLGMQRLLKKQGDFIGRALAQRPGLCAPDRLQLVGVRPLDAARRLRNGAQLTQARGRPREPRLPDFRNRIGGLRRLGGTRSAGGGARARTASV